MPEVFVSIGSSINRYQSVSAGLTSLAAEFDGLQVSPVFESEAVGFNGPAFLNLAVQFTSQLDVVSLINRLKAIEDRHGRNRALAKCQPQTLDLDLLTYGSVAGVLDGIVLPRAELCQHAFILWPLAELAPQHVCPGLGQTFLQLWQQWQGNQLLQPVDFYWHQRCISVDQIRFGCSALAANRE